MGIMARSSSVYLPSPVRLPYSQEPFWKNTASPAKNSLRESSPVLADSSLGSQVLLLIYRSQMAL